MRTQQIHLKGNFQTREVWLNGRKLNPKRSLKKVNHSPDGFNWGYGGSGPAQLALAICLRLFDDEGLQVYQRFKWKYIATLPQSDFELSFIVDINALTNNSNQNVLQ